MPQALQAGDKAELRIHAPYRNRPARFVELWEPREWRLKVYGVSSRGDGPRAEVLAAAKDAVAGALPDPALSDTRYGVGFVGIHEGPEETWVFVDWWEDENELHHRLFIAPSAAPAELQPAGQTRPIACVYDLGIILFEREAWIRNVLAPGGGPGLDAYLADVPTGRV